MEVIGILKLRVEGLLQLLKVLEKDRVDEDEDIVGALRRRDDRREDSSPIGDILRDRDDEEVRELLIIIMTC